LRKLAIFGEVRPNGQRCP